LLKTVCPKDEGGGLSFLKMTMCGLGAGAIGAAVGNPADLAMVRMQADGRLPMAGVAASLPGGVTPLITWTIILGAVSI
jgi:hypothetical protein